MGVASNFWSPKWQIGIEQTCCKGDQICGPFTLAMDLWILPDLSISTGEVEVTSLLIIYEKFQYCTLFQSGSKFPVPLKTVRTVKFKSVSYKSASYRFTSPPFIHRTFSHQIVPESLCSPHGAEKTAVPFKITTSTFESSNRRFRKGFPGPVGWFGGEKTRVFGTKT